jgi:hypothetical protein
MAQPACGQAFEGGLVGGGGGHVRAGVEVIQVHLADQLGLLQQHPGGPERVVKVGPAALQLGGQGAVQHQVAGLLQEGVRAWGRLGGAWGEQRRRRPYALRAS